jgi:hypothetical protein
MMEAQIVDLAQWKRAHPPVIVCLNAALAMGLTWQKLWLKVLFGAHGK